MKKSTFYDYQKSINKVIEYIEQNLEKNLDLNVLAKISGFSQYHFHRIFFDLTGETLNNYIRRIRIEKSSLKLLKVDESITMIALEVGYKTPSSYNKSFKQYYGITPKEYRQNYHDSKNILQDKDFVLKKQLIKNMNILYVEDEEELRETYQEILSMLVNKVFIAKDGKDALEIFEANSTNIDLIISDIRMPNIDGIEFATMIKEKAPQIPIILTTAFSDTSYLLKAIKIGVSDYVLKPISVENIIESIYKVMLPIVQKNRLHNSESLLDETLYITQIMTIVSENNNKTIDRIVQKTNQIDDENIKHSIVSNTKKLNHNCDLVFDILQVDIDTTSFEVAPIISKIFLFLQLAITIDGDATTKSFKSNFSKIILYLAKIFKDESLIPKVTITQEEDEIIITFATQREITSNLALLILQKNTDYIDGVLNISNKIVTLVLPKEL